MTPARIKAIRELLGNGTPKPWETAEPNGQGYLRIMGQVDGDADDQGRTVISWPHIADVIDTNDEEANATLIVALVNHAEEFLSAAERVGELEDRVEELERDQEVISAEFEKDCWRAVRSLLERCGLTDFSYGVSAQDACDHVMESIAGAEARVETAEAQIAELTAKLDGVREALRPFGKLATEYEDGHHKPAVYVDDGELVKGQWVRLGWLRRARTALAAITPAETGGAE